MRIRASLLLLIASQSAFATPVVEPGKWQVKSRLVSEFGSEEPVVDRRNNVNRSLGEQTLCVMRDTPLAKTLGLPGSDADRCRYHRYSVKGGRLDVGMRCKAGKVGPVSIDLAGTYAADHYALRMTTIGISRGMVTQIEGKRLRSC